MQPDRHLEPLKAAGCLALARMIPVLERSAFSLLREFESFIERGPVSTAEEEVDFVSVLGRWGQNSGEFSGDVRDPTYLHSVGVQVAATLTSGESATEILERRLSNLINGWFWGVCDEIVHSRAGFTRPEFHGIKTTLKGVEHQWREEDSRSLRKAGVGIHGVYAGRLAEVRAKYPIRRRIAHVVAECAGWGHAGTGLGVDGRE